MHAQNLEIVVKTTQNIRGRNICISSISFYCMLSDQSYGVSIITWCNTKDE